LRIIYAIFIFYTKERGEKKKGEKFRNFKGFAKNQRGGGVTKMEKRGERLQENKSQGARSVLHVRQVCWGGLAVLNEEKGNGEAGGAVGGSRLLGGRRPITAV